MLGQSRRTSKPSPELMAKGHIADEKERNMDGRPNKVAVTEGAALRTKRTGKPKHASSLSSKLTCRETGKQSCWHHTSTAYQNPT